MKPTEYAKVHLENVKAFGDRMVNAGDNKAEYQMASGAAVSSFAFALDELTTALRATYMMIEALDKRLDRIERTRKPF